jgi:hypothetical protein
VAPSKSLFSTSLYLKFRLIRSREPQTVLAELAEVGTPPLWSIRCRVKWGSSKICSRLHLLSATFRDNHDRSPSSHRMRSRPL